MKLVHFAVKEDLRLKMDPILKQVVKEPSAYRKLRKDLKSARMDVTYTGYIRSAILNSIGVALLISLAVFLLTRATSLPFISGIEPILVLSGTLNEFRFADLLFIIVYPIVAIITFQGYMLYPSFNASARKTKIDLMLPHAVSFCYGMSKGGIPVYDIFKDLSMNRNVYGEVSTEVAYVIRDVELMGKDTSTAIRNAAYSSPSPTFQDFLLNLIPMFESGSTVDQYFSVKMNQYFDHARKTQEMFLKTLEMIAEVYVVAFVATPIFLMIMLVSAGMTNVAQSGSLYLALYFGIPLGSIAFIVLLDSISPKEDLGIKFVKRILLRKPNVNELLEENDYEKKIRSFNQKKKKMKILDLLKNPLRPLYQEPIRASVISLILVPFPFLLTEYTFDKQIILGTIAALAPVSLAYEYKSRKMSKLDKDIPEFLRNIAEMNEIGLSLKGAIGMLLKSNVGLLSGEIKRVWIDMEWGNQMKDALYKFENRVGTPALRRAVTLIVKASEVNDNTKDVLLIAANDSENVLSLRKDRFQSGFVYLSTVYIAFGTFLYVCYSLSVQFLGSIGQGAGVSMDNVIPMMFFTSGMLGFFSGIITGQMAEGKVVYGLKHSVIFLALTYAVFTTGIGY
jgi:flagellar protein FlaJ